MKVVIALAVTLIVFAEAASLTLSQSKSESVFGCYAHEVAWTSGKMNIRIGPNTQWPIHVATQAGARLDVLQSVQGADYCWLRVNVGLWMAKTGLVSPNRYVPPVPTQIPVVQVQAEAPAPAPVAGAPDHIISSAGRRIPLHDHAEFRQAMAAGFYYVRDVLGQPWWDYIEIIDDVRYAPGRCSRGYACMNRRYKVIHFGERHPLTPRSIASTLVHEACHMWQVRENRHHGRDYSLPYEDRPWEHECEAKEREAGL